MAAAAALKAGKSSKGTTRSLTDPGGRGVGNSSYLKCKRGESAIKQYDLNIASFKKQSFEMLFISGRVVAIIDLVIPSPAGHTSFAA